MIDKTKLYIAPDQYNTFVLKMVHYFKAFSIAFVMLNEAVSKDKSGFTIVLLFYKS